MANNIKGTHFQGPVLGSDATRGGLFRDVPVAAHERVRSPYKVIVEDFPVAVADNSLPLGGLTETDLNTATSPSTLINVDGLLINAGTKADAGTSIQFNAAPAALTTISHTYRTIGPITSTATLMDNKEIFFETRVGFQGEATVWDGKAIVAWMVTDATPLATATGALTIADGGGMGFAVAETGELSYFSSAAAITTSTDTGINVLTDVAAEASGDFKFYTLGCRALITDASASTGSTEFYVNGRKVATLVDSVPMDSTEVYSMTYTCVNGPAQESDMLIDWIVTGKTREGLVRPYSAGNW